MRRLTEALDRFLPLIITAGIVAVAYFLFIQTPLNTYLRARTEITSLQGRLRTARENVARASGVPAVDVQASLALFEKQMSPDEKVSDVTAIFSKAVLDSTSAEKLRTFVIETSDRIKAAEGSQNKAVTASTGTLATSPDPRFGLFPYKVHYTPVKVAFSSNFEGIANFMWKIRDLPTIIEVKSATLTRGLPFMKMEILVWVYQRGPQVTEQPAPPPAQAPAPPPAQPNPLAVPTVPRIAG